jgi:hypothetical protein
VAGYHFGTKADLVRAITRRFTAEVERSRVQMLAALDDSAGLTELLRRPSPVRRRPYGRVT